MYKLEDKEQPDAKNAERKPYNAPRIEESARFEHLVLACGFFAGDFSCDTSMNGPRSM